MLNLLHILCGSKTKSMNNKKRLKNREVRSSILFKSLIEKLIIKRKKKTNYIVVFLRLALCTQQ